MAPATVNAADTWLGFLSWLLLLSCPLRFHQESQSPALMLLATSPAPPAHTQTPHPPPTGSVFTRETESYGEVNRCLILFTVVPLSVKKNDKVIFISAFGFKFWACLPQGKRNSPLCLGVLNRDISRSQVKVLHSDLRLETSHIKKNFSGWRKQLLF